MNPSLRSRPDLVDLHALTDRWRVRRDTRGAERGLTLDNLPIILGRRGHVSAHDLTTLCVYVTGRTLPRLLRELPAGWRRHQVGDGEANLLARLEDLDRACEVVRAYRRRKLSPEDIAAKTERLRKVREARVAGHFRGQDAPGRGCEGPDSRLVLVATENVS